MQRDRFHRSLDKTLKGYFQLFFVIFSYFVFCLFATSEQQCSRLIQKMETTRQNIQKMTIFVVPTPRQAPQRYFQLFSIIFSYFSFSMLLGIFEHRCSRLVQTRHNLQQIQHGVLRSLGKTLKIYFQLFFAIFRYFVFCLIAISEQHCSQLIQKMENTRHNIQQITICAVAATRQASPKLFSVIVNYFQLFSRCVWALS